MSEFKEKDHPRDRGGKFTYGNDTPEQDKTVAAIRKYSSDPAHDLEYGNLPSARRIAEKIPKQAWDNMSAAEMSKKLRREYEDNLLTNSRKPVKIVMLPKDMYAEFDSVIRTRYGNKIPNNGYILLHNPIKGYNDFMLFNHDDEADRNVCTVKLDLDLDRDEIDRILSGGKKK